MSLDFLRKSEREGADMPLLVKKRDQERVRQNLKVLACDLSLSNEVVEQIVRLYFVSWTGGIQSDELRKQLLQAKKDLQTARTRLAAFEKAWQAALRNSYLWNHLLQVYGAEIPYSETLPAATTMDPEFRRKLAECVSRMDKLDDLAPIKNALDTVAKRDNFRWGNYLPAQTRGRRPEVRQQSLIAGLTRVAESLSNINTPEARNSFVVEALRALESDRGTKSIKNRIARSRRKS